MNNGNGLAYAFGPFRVEPEKRLLLRDGLPVSLTPKAFEMLLILLQNNGKLVRKNALMEALWPETFVEEGNLTQNIFTLRKALGETAQDHRYILTIPGAGYQFTEEVSQLGGSSPIQNGNWNYESPALPRSEPAIRGIAQHRRWEERYVVIAAVLCTIAVIMLLVQSRSLVRVHPQELSGTAHLAVPRRSVAVLGFEDVSANPTQKWVSTALSEMVNTELGAGQELRVVPAEDVSRGRNEVAWKGAGSLSKDTLEKLHRNLESDLVVLGSYATLGQGNNQRLRIDLGVQDTRSGELIATIAETGATADLFDVVSRIGVRLRQQLHVPEMSPTEALEVRASTPSTLAATQLYAQGLEKLRVFDALGARDLLQKALALDPNYPLAHAALADAWSTLGYDLRATSEALKAFQLSTRLAAVDRLTIEGRYRIATRDWSKAVAVYRSLYELLPDSVDYALGLARAQTSGGHPRDALQTLGSLRQSDANEDPRIDLETARAWNQLGDFGRMATALSAAADKAKRKSAQLVLARALNQQCWVSRFVGQQHGIEECREAQRIYAAVGDHGGEADTLRVLGDVVSVSDPAAAMELYQQSLIMQRKIAHLSGEAIVLNEMAIQYSTQGNHRRAREFFEQARQIFLRTENRVDAGGLLINIGYELAAQGDLTRAQKSYEAATELGREIGNKDMEALATTNTGLIEELKGNLENAKESFQRALTLFDESGDRVGRSDTMFDLGEIARAEGNLGDAHNFHEQALVIRKEQQRKTAIAESELALARVSLDQGHPAPGIEQLVRSAAETFTNNKALDDQVTAEALLTQILFAQNKLPEANKEADRAVALAQAAQRGVRLSMEGEIASVWVATAPKAHLQDLQRTLSNAIIEAHSLGYAEAELRLRWARAQSETRSGKKEQANSEIAMVRAEAAKRRFALIGR